MKTKAMTKQCPQCNRKLELNETNFRRFNGSWRNKCRACQNDHKRKVYHLKKKLKTSVPRVSCGSKSKDFAEKYKQIFALEEKIGILPDNLYSRIILNSELLNGLWTLIGRISNKQPERQRYNTLLEQYHQKIKFIKSKGLSIDCPAGKVDSVLNQHNQIKLTKTA